MKSARQRLGHWGENLAAEYLSERGYTILDRNARTPYGEIDLVTCQVSCDGPVLVFVEVKTRTSTQFGLPEQSITLQKQAHLLAAIQSYLQTHAELEGDWRVDVIAILRSGTRQQPVITHFENALS